MQPPTNLLHTTTREEFKALRPSYTLATKINFRRNESKC